MPVLVQSDAKGVSQQAIDQIDKYLADQIETKGIPGFTIAMVSHGEVIYSRAWGVRRLGAEEKLTPNHVFHFASVSKPFVATAIMQLVEKGKMNLDAHVTDYLPYFKLDDARYRDITIRQMLNHTAGMPDVEDYEWGTPQLDEGAAERYVRQIANEKLLWAPGGEFRYSNIAFDTLGDVIAKVSGVSFEQYIQDNILNPLGMANSSFIYPDIDERLRTSGHVGDPAGVSDVYPYNRRHAPSSTLNSSVNEMTRWLFVNLNRGEWDGKRILAEESYDLLWNGTIEVPGEEVRVGLSWFVSEWDDPAVVMHSGSDTGFRSVVLMAPEESFGVVMASNWMRTDTNEIVFHIFDIIFPPDEDN